MIAFGEVPAGSILPIPFGTYAGPGNSVTISGFATSDIKVYKGTSMTQRSSTAGFTLMDTDGIDIDAITGIHGFSIDLSNNTDAGFYAVGSFYWVVVDAITADGQTVSFVAASFRIKSITLERTIYAIGRGTVTTGASTTSIPTSALALNETAASGVVADQFKGRVVLFDGDTTTAGLRGAAAVISASSASNTPTLTVAALPATPVSGDTFSVI